MSQRLDEAPGVGRTEVVVTIRARDERAVTPDRFAVLAPVTVERPTRQRFARIPFALTIMEQGAGRETLPEAQQQAFGQLTLLRSLGRGLPLRIVGVLERNESRLPTHREADIDRADFRINRLAERINTRP